MSDADQKPEPRVEVPAWTVNLPEGGKVSLVRYEPERRNVIVFRNKHGDETTVILSDDALAGLVALAVSKGGVPINVG